MSKQFIILSAVLAVVVANAADNGTSVFADDFATNQTLAEHWNVEGDVKSEDGILAMRKVVFQTRGELVIDDVEVSLAAEI